LIFEGLGKISPPSHPNSVDFSISYTAWTKAPTQLPLNWEAGGIRELTLDSNKIE